jgi:hypothetical protein
LQPYEIIIINEKKRALDYSELAEICDDTEDGTNNDTYEIVATISFDKKKALNANKN